MLPGAVKVRVLPATTHVVMCGRIDRTPFSWASSSAGQATFVLCATPKVMLSPATVTSPPKLLHALPEYDPASLLTVRVTEVPATSELAVVPSMMDSRLQVVAANGVGDGTGGVVSVSSGSPEAQKPHRGGVAVGTSDLVQCGKERGLLRHHRFRACHLGHRHGEKVTPSPFWV